MCLYVRVKKNEAQKVKEEFFEKGLLDRRKFLKEGNFVLIPVRKKINGYEIVKRASDEKIRPTTLKDALKGKLTKKELDLVPVRFDIVGDVAVLHLNPSLAPKSKKIAEALLKIHKNVKTVCVETGVTRGEFRIKPVSVILGKNTLTEHRESGLVMMLDVREVYFSPRLSAERLRIAELVRPGERILVMFAGIGPYALVIAKKQPKVEIVAVELNPAAFKFLQENIVKNKMQDKIKAYRGDVREIVPKLGKFDRIIMPLPKGAENFLDIAKKAIKPKGIIHFYQFSRKDDPFSKAEQIIKGRFPKAGVLFEKICGDVAPRKVRVVIDFKVN